MQDQQNQKYISGKSKIEDEVFYSNRRISRALRRLLSISNAYAARPNQNEPVVGNTKDDKHSGQRNQQPIFLCICGNGARRGATNQSPDASKNKKATRLQNGWLGLTSFASA
jgi:hypothetical protein